jgi:hypothetical protein
MPISLSGSLNLSGSLTTTGTITATTLVVQTITSSISSITGSTNFGSLAANTHTFTGSLNVTGSATFSGALTAGATTLNGNLEFASGYFINMPWASDTRTMWERYNSATYFQRISSNGTLRQLRLESNGAYGNASIVLDGQSNSTVTTTITSDNTSITGNLGIGISTTPSSILYISAQSDTVGGSGVRLGNSAVSRIWNTRFGTNTDLSYNLDFYDGTSWNNRLKLTYTGNVGIGVSPSSWGSGTTALQIGTAATLWNRSSDNLLVLASNSYFDGSADKQITTNTSNRMYFVNGGTYFERAASTAAGSSTPWASSMVISANGSIGAPTAGTNIYNASDIRLKQNITTITDGLNKVMGLNPVKFNWIHDFEPTENDKDLLGFIAQEVQTVLPEVVENFGNNSITVGETVIENPLRVNEKFIIPVLVKAIQELTARVQYLENK